MNQNLVLVVDDDSSLRRVMKMQLEEAGYQVALASDGEHAGAIIDEQRPKLVITDLLMPPWAAWNCSSRFETTSLKLRSS